MDGLKFGKGIRRVIQLHKSATGDVTPMVLYRRKRKKNKASPMMRPIEREVRRSLNAPQAALDDYLSRHKRSNRKRKDGWVRDLSDNVFKATRKGLKKANLSRLPLMP